MSVYDKYIWSNLNLQVVKMVSTNKIISNHSYLIKKLIYKSNYMGCKENDIIFGRFAKHNLEQMDAEELLLYAKLLEYNDADLLSWITGEAKPDEEFELLIHKIKKYTEAQYV